MADFPTTVKPAFITPFRVPGAFISQGHSGRAQLRAALGMGREWDMTWNPIQVGTPNVDALLAFIEDAWNQGKTFDLTHPYTPGSGLAPNGVGSGTPLVNGANQTGASLITDGWGLTATNLASNPGFEAGVLTPHFTSAAGGTWAAVSDGGARTGSYAARYATAGQTGTAYMTLNGSELTPSLHPVAAEGETYFVEVWQRVFAVDPANEVTVRLQFRDAAGALVGETLTTPVVPINSWVLESVSGVAPAGTAYVCAVIYVANDGLAPSIYLDDCVLRSANAMRPGDVFRVAGLPQLFRVTALAAMDGAGNATISFSPPIVAGGSPADNAVITRTGVKLAAYIASPPNLPSIPPGRWWAGLTLTLREAL